MRSFAESIDLSNFRPLKGVPAPVRLLIRPMVFAALGLHALLLFTPLPSEQKPKKTDDKENPIKITQLPTAKPAAKPQLKIAKPPLPKVNRPKPVVAPPVLKTSTPPRTGSPTKSADGSTPFADFPHYPASTPNCYGKTDLGDNCREASASLTAVISYFQKALPEKKYTISPIGGDTAKVKIFQVSKGGQSLKLSILADGDGKSVYVLAPQAVDSLDKLKKATGVPPELGAIAKLLDSTFNLTTDDSATSFNLSNPSDFFHQDEQNQSNELTNNGILESRVVSGQTPSSVYAALDPALKAFDSVSPEGSYGGGELYELKKGAFTGYLNLVPGKGGSTVVFVWTAKP